MRGLKILATMLLLSAAPAMAGRGVIVEVSPGGGGGFVGFTGPDGKVIPGSFTFGTGRFEVEVPDKIGETEVTDFINGAWTAPSGGGGGGGGGGGRGAFNWLYGESLIFNTLTGRWEFENMFTRLYLQIGVGGHLVIPDVFADTNNDGTLDELDVMYSWIDINACNGHLPGFNIGDVFNIVNGKVSGYECMWFSPTEITLDPILGPVPGGGQWFNGGGVVLALHDGTPFTPPTTEPEPDAWMLMMAGFGLVGTALRRTPKRVAA